MPLCFEIGYDYATPSERISPVRSVGMLRAKQHGDDEAVLGHLRSPLRSALWATLVIIVALQETPIATRGDARAFILAAAERAKD
jgi:hypothetical protein